MHRREGTVAAALPATVPAPRLLDIYDDGDWVALAFKDVDGREPQLPWRSSELAAVLDALAGPARTLTPPHRPLPLSPASCATARSWNPDHSSPWRRS
jgi:hypothetical protein